MAIRFQRLILFPGLACLALSSALALAPHDVAVLVNRNSAASLEVANEFVTRRGIPPQNVVYLDLPADPGHSTKPEEFTRSIWNPATDVLESRRVAPHILAWVYSAGFPTRVLSEPNTSICGMTLVRNRLPAAAEIDQGSYVSPFFAGPDREGGPRRTPSTFEQSRARLGEAMPLPSMMLGVVASNANTVTTVMECVQSGLRADATAPTGTIYLVLNDSVRSRARSWQFRGAQEALGALGVSAVVSSNPPSREAGVMGLQLGVPHVRAGSVGSFRPGAMAEHLTSFAGAFHTEEQSKLTEWIAAGATASAGTVTEPKAVWTKFPSAYFFVYYASGLTMIESLYHAILSPLQTLLVGEPLASPWGKISAVTLACLQEGALEKEATFIAQGWAGGQPTSGGRYSFFLDGRCVQGPSQTARLTLDLAPLADGFHQLRAVQYVGGIGRPGFSVLDFEVNQWGRTAQIDCSGLEGDGSFSVAVVLPVSAAGHPVKVGLLVGERVIDTAPVAEQNRFILDPAVVGYGPVAVQAVAYYEDGMQVRGRPVPVSFSRP